MEAEIEVKMKTDIRKRRGLHRIHVLIHGMRRDGDARDSGICRAGWLMPALHSEASFLGY
jgi:hypothetical protein